MKSISQIAGEHFQRNGRAYLVLSIAILSTMVVFYRVTKNVEARAEQRFNEVAAGVQVEIRERLDRYLGELLSIRGLFAAAVKTSLLAIRTAASRMRASSGRPLGVSIGQRTSGRCMS